MLLRVCLLIVLACFAMDSVGAKKKKKKDEAKMLSGISLVGNKEAPKSLFIVPWKSSEMGVENGLSSSLLNEKLGPVDKDVFNRELNYYQLSN